MLSPDLCCRTFNDVLKTSRQGKASLCSITHVDMSRPVQSKLLGCVQTPGVNRNDRLSNKMILTCFLQPHLLQTWRISYFMSSSCAIFTFGNVYFYVNGCLQVRVNIEINRIWLVLFASAACYAKNFGPKGFGYGQGAGALVHAQWGQKTQSLTFLGTDRSVSFSC